MPTSTEEVSRVLQVLVDSWCRFAVKCGGHSRYPDDSVSIGGVTIDMGQINSTVVSADNTTARVGGGALTRQIFAALDPYGLAHVGGRVGQVGIGGFTLGGGTSVLAAMYGWALDNVIGYEVREQFIPSPSIFGFANLRSLSWRMLQLLPYPRTRTRTYTMLLEAVETILAS
jgi:FAD/FMN-containing dehydrogenase